MMSDLYKEILEFNKMSFDRKQLVEDYIQQMIEGMDYKTMECLVYDTLKDNLSNYTDEELITEVTDYYPELLEDVDAV
jgi:predicted RNA-binding protein Jag